MLKAGDKVKSSISGCVGVVTKANLPGMRDCVLVQFTNASDGLCLPRHRLENLGKVQPDDTMLYGIAKSWGIRV